MVLLKKNSLGERDDAFCMATTATATTTTSATYL